MTKTTHQPPPRKNAFKAALAFAGMSAKAFAESEGVTQVQLYAVLRGARQSQRLLDSIDRFIAEHTATVAA